MVKIPCLANLSKSSIGPSKNIKIAEKLRVAASAGAKRKNRLS
jgi:hypothetical protein